MIHIDVFLATYIVLVVLATLVLSIYGLLFKPHATKKIIALTILGDTANIFAIVVGFRYIYPIRPPELWTEVPTPLDIIEFLKVSVDPLPQALVLTAIVINMSITLFIAFIALQTYRIYGTLDLRKIGELRRGAE